MADFNDPLVGNVGDLSKALDALEARIKSAVARVAQIESSAGAAAGRGGVVLPPGVRSAGPGASAATKAAKEYQEVLSDIERIQQGAAGRTSVYSSELQRQIQLYGTSSNALRKHGALTTEFLSEAAKGRVTLSELRYQVGATIAKFSGWTAAAAAVYGVVGGLRQVGSGAVEAATGVNQLERVLFSRTGGPSPVDRDKAIEGFRRRSSQFNLPVEDVASAQYQIGKVFQSQEGSYKATEALLYAVKVGELDVVDASRLLISTVNAFGLQFDDLLPLMDQYNSLQNGMGVATRDTAAGVAKASGQWRAAGGSLRYLVSLVGAGTKVTGLSGDQFGTLLQRSAGLTQRPQNQQELRSFGIDPRQNIENIIRDAFKVAQTLPRRDLLKLSEALSTPQLAPRFTALLGRPDIVNRAERLTDPRTAEGSSARELRTVLNGFQERMRRITVDLQQVGAAGAISGALVLPGAALSGLDHALRLLSEMGAVFSHLNPEMRAAIATITQVVLVMRLLRRFNVGDTFAQAAPNTAGLFRQSPERRTRNLLGSALDRERDFYIGERERAGRAAAVAAERRLAQSTAFDAINQRGPAQFRAPGVSEEQAVVQYRDALNRQQQAVIESDRVAVGLANEEAALRQQIAAAQDRSNLYQAEVVRGNKTALAFAAENNIYLPPHLGLPTHENLIDPKAPAAAPPAPTFAQRFKSRGQEWVTRERQWNAAVSDTRTWQAIESAGLAGVSATAAGAAAATRAGGVIREVAGGIRSLGASIIAGLTSPMGLLITAVTILPLAYQWVNDQNKKLKEQIDRANKDRVRPIRRSDLPGLVKDLDKQAGQAPSLWEQVTYPIRHPSLLPTEIPNPKADAAARARDALERRIRRQRSAEDLGQPIPELDVADIAAERDKALANFRKGTHSKAERESTLARLLREYDLSLQATRHSERDLALVHRSSARTRGEFATLASTPSKDLYAGMNLDDVATRAQQYIDIATSGRNVDRNLAKAAQGLRVARTQINAQSPPENIAKVASDQQAIANGIQEAARGELERNLVFARTADQRKRAIQRYRDTLRRHLVTQPHKQVAAAEKALNQAEKQYAEAQEAANSLSGVALLDPKTRRNVLAKVDRLDARRQGRKAEVSQVKQIEAAFAQFFRQFSLSAIEDATSLAETHFQEEADLAQAKAEIQAHALPENQRSASVLKTVNDSVARAIKKFGRNNKTTIGLIREQQGLQDQVQSDAESAASDANAIADARDALFVAGAGNPLERSRRELQAARNRLGRARGTGKQADILQAQADVRSQEIALAQQVVSDARDLINAQAAYAAAGTDDPYQQAVIESRRTHRILHRGGFQNRAERLQAQADARRADRDKLKSRQQEAYDDIQFLADIGKISREEEIRRLRHLESTIKKNKDLKRQIQRDIYSLTHQDQGELDLDVGNIRLPTLYDVRRLIAAGATGGPAHQSNVQQTNHFIVTRGADIDDVFGRVGDYLGSGGKAAMRSAGLI